MKFPVLIPNICDHPFTYTSEINLKVGDYVEVPFGKKKVNGVVWNNFEQNQSCLLYTSPSPRDRQK